MVSKEDDNGIVVLEWKDTRDVRILWLKHAPTLKPLAVVEYNEGKCGIRLF